MLKRFLVVIAVLSFSFSTIAQNIEGVNARLDAMAGSGASDDIGWTIHHPASLFNYPNYFQGSICLMPIPGIDRTYGAIIGIVQFNEMFYAGVTLNERTTMGGSFYSEGALIINAPHIDGEESAKGFPNLPNVNLCLKLSDNVQLGLGGYFEASSYDYKAKKIESYTAASGLDTIMWDEEHDGKKVRNNGFNVEARFKVGGWTIYPQLIVGFPKIKGTESYNTLDKAKLQLQSSPAAADPTEPFSNEKYTYDSPEGLRIRAASYFWGDIGNTFWLAGAIYENARYQFNKNTVRLTQHLDANGGVLDTVANETYDSIPSSHNSNFVHYFLAFVPSFSDNLYFSPEYDGGVGWYNGLDDSVTSTDASYDPTDTTFLFVYHNFRLGIEKFIDNFGWFDKIGFRCGVSAQWNKEWRHIEQFDDYTDVSDESIPWKSFFWGSDFTKKEAKITGGFGLTKGRGTFDVSCDFLKWQGQSVLTGPSAAMATITVDFSRSKEF